MAAAGQRSPPSSVLSASAQRHPSHSVLHHLFRLYLWAGRRIGGLFGLRGDWTVCQYEGEWQSGINNEKKKKERRSCYQQRPGERRLLHREQSHRLKAHTCFGLLLSLGFSLYYSALCLISSLAHSHSYSLSHFLTRLFTRIKDTVSDFWEWCLKSTQTNTAFSSAP